MKLADITHFVHTRTFAILMLPVFLIGVGVVYALGQYPPVSGDKGLVTLSANEWIQPGGWDLTASFFGNLVVFAALWFLSKFFNILRQSSHLAPAMFILFQLATPGLSAQLHTGIILAAVVGWAMVLIISCYKQRQRTRRVFLVFLTLSAACATQYCYAFFIPVFLVGCAQMRIFNARTITAAFLGILTPWWLMFGSGWLTPSMVRAPQFFSIFSEIAVADKIQMFVAMACSLFFLLTCFGMNVMKAIAYNARARAFNGLFSVVSLATIIALTVDYRNVTAYIPLLNFCAAYQVAAYFSNHRSERSGLAVCGLATVYIALYICEIAL